MNVEKMSDDNDLFDTLKVQIKTQTSQDYNITIPNTEDHKVPLDTRNVTIRKVRNTAVSKTQANSGDFGAQITHDFRALPVQPVKRKQTVVSTVPNKKNKTTEYSISKDLSVFDNSPFICVVLHGDKATAKSGQNGNSTPIRRSLRIQKRQQTVQQNKNTVQKSTKSSVTTINQQHKKK